MHADVIANGNARIVPVAPDHTDDDHELGRRLRNLRKERHLSLQALAERSGLSTGMLSLIERGKATPSIRSLRVLGQALAVPIAWFFTPSVATEPDASPFVVRADGRSVLRLTSTQLRKELMTPAGPGVEIYRVALEPGGSSGPEFLSQSGEKAGIVIDGSFRLWLDERPHLLGKGDSFRFPAHLPHRFDNPGPNAASVYWIVNGGRGSPERGSPLPGGEGQGEGRGLPE